MQMLSRTNVFALALCCFALFIPTAVADDDGGGDGGGWGPTIHIGGHSNCFGRLGLCLGGLRPIPGAALRPVPPPGPAPRVGPRGTWP